MKHKPRELWKPKVGSQWMPAASAGTRPAPVPKGYESVIAFTRRHGLNPRTVYRYMRERMDPLPHLHDEYGTGRYFVRSKEGDTWLARRRSQDEIMGGKNRTILMRQLKVLTTIAMQMDASGYPQTHQKCLEMIETFKHETGLENSPQPETDAETQSERGT